MWVLYSFIAMIGLVAWYTGAKIWSEANAFMALFVTGVGYVLLMPFLSKLFYGQWFAFAHGAVELGLTNMIGGGILATVFLVMAMNSGAEVSEVSVIVQSAVVVSVLVGLFVFRETVTRQQFLGIMLVCIGIFLVVFFSDHKL